MCVYLLLFLVSAKIARARNLHYQSLSIHRQVICDKVLAEDAPGFNPLDDLLCGCQHLITLLQGAQPKSSLAPSSVQEAVAWAKGTLATGLAKAIQTFPSGRNLLYDAALVFSRGMQDGIADAQAAQANACLERDPGSAAAGEKCCLLVAEAALKWSPARLEEQLGLCETTLQKLLQLVLTESTRATEDLVARQLTTTSGPGSEQFEPQKSNGLGNRISELYKLLQKRLECIGKTLSDETPAGLERALSAEQARASLLKLIKAALDLPAAMPGLMLNNELPLVV